MRHKLHMLAFGCAIAGMANPAVAQMSMPTWNLAPDFAMANLNREVLDRRLEDEQGDVADVTNRTVAATTAVLTFSPSAERRRANLAHFANETRRTNPESAAAMDAMFGRTDIIREFGAALSPYGYSVANVGDAYAAWWMLAWKAANGDTSDPTPAMFRAVQAQARDALASTPQMVGANDAQKQELAEALLMQAAMVEALNGMAQEQPELNTRVRRSVRQGARASGLDLDAMQLTENGFVSR